jgi:hypothetical protein
VERALTQLKERGYNIRFSQSLRSDGGVVMRGNDLLAASCDVMVTDTFTGNLLVKIFSAFTTGGDYESIGYGYGPGIGEGYERIIMILSRASGAPVAANAIKYAADLVKGNLLKIAKEEFEALNKLGWNDVISRKEKVQTGAGEEKEVTMPTPKPLAEEISGIDVLELEDMVKVLWQHGIYAESGMGCTGPVIRVSEDDYDEAVKIIQEALK